MVSGQNSTQAPPQSYAISGTLGASASGATVTLSGTASASTTADGAGNFTFTGVANGSYIITPSKIGFTFNPASQTVTVNGANVTAVAFTATAQSFSISGTITGGSGATVTLSGAARSSTTANNSGNFSFSGLANGSYTITPSETGFTFSPASQAVTVNGANVTGISFMATAQTQSFSISGTITGGSGATVILSGAATASTTANSSGNFTFTGLANGSYTVTPSEAGFTISPGSQTVTVNGANVTGVNFTATAQTQTFSISGTITGGSGATVMLSGAATASTIANSFGNFTFTGLANGSYTVIPSEVGFTITPTSKTVTVNGANITGVNFTATAQTFSISGTITGGSAATVTLSGAASASTTANSSGSFTFTGLANGSYTVTPSEAGFTMSPAYQAVTVNGANITGVNFTATVQTFTVSGSISPAADATGTTLSLSGTASASTTPNASGSYSFNGLANGSYAVTPSNTAYTFSPTSQAVTVSNANVTGVNFNATSASPTYTISGTIGPASVGSGATVSLSGTAVSSTIANSSGSYSFTGLSSGSYTVTPSSQTATFSPTSQQVTVSNANVTGVNFTATATANIIFFDDFNGSSLSSAWTIISRHGEYAQSETECNTPQQISVANSILTITTAVGPATCGDFNIDGSVRHAPQSWPYVSGDVQWTTFNFTYGTLEVRAQFPPQGTGVWPAIWMLGQNCQLTNIYTADTGYDTCPDPGTTGYQEIDTVECDPGGTWCHFIAYNSSISPENLICNYPVDTNWHVYTMIWKSGSLSLSMDGQPLPGCSIGGNAVPSNPMFLILQTQTATGSPFGPPNNAMLPTTFNIDYVKVTQP